MRSEVEFAARVGVYLAGGLSRPEIIEREGCTPADVRDAVERLRRATEDLDSLEF